MRNPRVRGAAAAGMAAGLLLASAGGTAPPASAAPVPPASSWPGGPPAAAAALHSGHYQEAEALYRQAGRTPEALRGLAETLRLTGRYREALAVLTPPDPETPPEPALLLERARIHLERGEAAPARDALDEMLAQVRGKVGTDWLEGETLLGLLQLRVGEREAGFARLDEVIAVYDELPAAAFSARELTAVGQAAARLGFRSPGLFRDALRVFDEAAALDPADPLPRLLAAELLLDKFNTAEARESLESVLRQNPRNPRALYGLARLPAGSGGTPLPAADPLAEALAINPRFPPARALEVHRLLERERGDEAQRRALSAVGELPDAPEVMSALGAALFLAEESHPLAELETRFRAVWPGDPRLEIGLAAAAERRRRYREAARRARAALRLEPGSASASRLLGLNLLRLGRMEEGRTVLEEAFSRDPFDALVKNTLDLLDELDGYEVVSSPPFEIVLPAAEAELLAPYVEELAREALTGFGERYGFVPEAGLRIEIYDRSADFSVRTVGIPGIGAHGVCFGEVIALESPSAREAGTYHWASTLWHELAHVVSLGMTDNRVPRWFTEGLSLLEERRRFGDGAPLGFYAALRDGRLLDLPELNDGFVRPSWPGQVAVSYFHASLVLEHIEAEYGFSVILEMLEGFRRGFGSSEVIRQTLDLAPEELDAAVDAGIGDRYGAAARDLGAPAAGAGHPPAAGGTDPGFLVERADAAPRNFVRQLLAGIALFRAERDAEAEERLQRAAEIAPDYGGADGPQGFLARIFTRAGQMDRARSALTRHLRRVPAAYDAWLRLAELESAAEDPSGAADALVSAIHAYPMFAEPHERLAELAAAAGRPRIEVRERLAVLATDPPDRAGALFGLAQAHFGAGDRQSARRRVLEALEIAPTFEEALRLLLELRREG